MDYFEFYNLPVSLKVDDAALKRTFYENSKKYHPDFYTLESEEKQAEILELSSLNNEAYQVLSNFDKRLKYLLDTKNVLAEEGQNKVPQDFLLEMLDFNEVLMELELDFDEQTYQQAVQNLEQIEQDLYEDVRPIVENYDDTTVTDAELSALKDFYLKKRYLLRIRENLSTFATP